MEKDLVRAFQEEFGRVSWAWRVRNELAIRVGISGVCIRMGIVPGVCPICLNPHSTLEFHHWGFKYNLTAFRQGNYRRVCPSCNRILSPLYRDVRVSKRYRYWTKRFLEHGGRLYTDRGYTWEEQFSLLSEYFGSFLKLGQYPNFDGIEREWSRPLPIEERLYKQVLEVWRSTRLRGRGGKKRGW